MRKASLKRIAGMVLCVVFVAFNTRAADKTVTNKELGFEITFPEAWTVDEKPPGGLAIRGASRLAKDAKGAAVIVLRFTEGAEAIPLSEYVEGILPGLKKVTPNFELVENIELKLGRATACRLTFLYDHPKLGGRCKAVSYILVDRKHRYTISTSLSTDDFDKYTKDFDNIFQSFKIIDAK